MRIRAAWMVGTILLLLAVLALIVWLLSRKDREHKVEMEKVRSDLLRDFSLEFIKTVRFNEACRLLKEKEHTVSEIAYMVGFATPSYFAADFHRFMGCTPSDWVRKNAQ